MPSPPARRTLALVTLLALGVLSFPLAPASPPVVPQDDAGSGRDAPSGPEGTLALAPGRVYAGLLPDDGDVADWFALHVRAGDVVEVRHSGAWSCVTLITPALEEEDSSCILPVVEGASVTARVVEDGSWFVRVERARWPATSHPEAYRFGVGVNARAPAPQGADLRLLSSGGVLAPVELATVAGPHVVVAVIDTGVDPYHEFFRAPALTVHPSAWLPGYPVNAEPVNLSFDAPAVRDARFADAEAWARVRLSTHNASADAFDAHVAWFPGTRVVAALSFGDFQRGRQLAYDEHGHGTASAGLAAGANLPVASGNVLVVSVEAHADVLPEAILWAARQPWIDMVSVSWGAFLGMPVFHKAPGTLEVSHATREAVANGKPVFLASMNGFTNTGLLPEHCVTYTNQFTGPPWVTRIGAAEPWDGNPTWWHCLPVDAIARTGVASPRPHHYEGKAWAGGTSASAPNVAGHLARLLVDARDAGLDVAPLDALEFLLNASRPAEPSVGVGREPSTPVTQPVDQGFGLVDAAALDRARERLFAGLPPEPRPELDAWRAADDALRAALWEPLTDATAP